MTKTLVRDEKFKLTKNIQNARRFFEERLSFLMTPHTLNDRLNDKNFVIVDVREPEQYHKGHIRGSINIPMENFEKHIRELSKNHIHVLYCHNQFCHLSTRAAYLMVQNNIPAMVLEGGWENWEINECPIER